MNIPDVATRQRLLNLAGYGPLAVDGIAGPLTRAAEARWNHEQQDILTKYATLDPRSEKNVLTLLPSFQRHVRRWMTVRAIPAAASLSLTVKIICGTRDFAEQQRLYNQGRTTPGARVTNARPGTSFHNYGVAFDVCLFDSTGRPLWDDVHYVNFFSRAGVPDDCVWGGHFKSFKDYPHVESHRFGATPSDLRRRSEK